MILLFTLDVMWVHTAGEVDFEEFLLLMDRKAKESRDDMENSGLLEAFKVFDKDGNGVITKGAAPYLCQVAEAYRTTYAHFSSLSLSLSLCCKR